MRRISRAMTPARRVLAGKRASLVPPAQGETDGLELLLSGWRRWVKGLIALVDNGKHFRNGGYFKQPTAAESGISPVIDIVQKCLTIRA